MGAVITFRSSASEKFHDEEWIIPPKIIAISAWKQFLAFGGQGAGGPVASPRL